MGSKYNHFCRDCDYNCEIGGQVDVGMQGSTVTIRCDDCCELLDVPIEDDQKCPKCGSQGVYHWRARLKIASPAEGEGLLVLIDDPTATDGKCPKCGGEVLRDIVPSLMWD